MSADRQKFRHLGRCARAWVMAAETFQPPDWQRRFHIHLPPYLCGIIRAEGEEQFHLLSTARRLGNKNLGNTGEENMIITPLLISHVHTHAHTLSRPSLPPKNRKPVFHKAKWSINKPFCGLFCQYLRQRWIWETRRSFPSSHSLKGKMEDL